MKDASEVLEQAVAGEHEQVVMCSDHESGLQAVIAIYSTALGPSLGGTRFHPYASAIDAVGDALMLSKAMAYKAALAGLDLGGGKAVIIGDPRRHKSETLLRAFGRFIETLNGRYYAACDVGTHSADMDIVSRETSFVTGRTEQNGGAGDSSVLTALGVFHGMRAAAEHAWGTGSLEGMRVGIVGVGKVGQRLAGLLLEAGAEVLATDINGDAVAAIKRSHPGVTVVASENELVRADLDIYAPCAMGGTVNESLLSDLTAKVICGAANNQLAHPQVERSLADLGVTYAPDYCVNSGGVIQLAEELSGFNFERARARTEEVYDRTLSVLASAARDGITATAAADRVAEDRMNDITRLRRIYLSAR